MRRSRAFQLLAFAPVLVVLYANAMFVRNHFYARGPYMHDSGWFSDTVFHAGIVPRNPKMYVEMPYYWGWHISGIVSIGSILSYLFPGDRVDWYSLFQALIYAPLAIAVPLVVPREARTGVASGLFVAACSLAFAFGGQVLSCIGYPHFEIFSPAGIAIMLAALATGRERLAWVGLAMSVATREDCGFHSASFLVAVLAADFFGRPFPIARRRVLLMTAVALGSTVFMMVMQKRFFVSVHAFEIYITGTPPYAHLTKAAIVDRLIGFGTKCAFIWMAMLATVVVAVARRDARYLLGWAVTLPWLLLNITAVQEIKAYLSVYTGFPFVGSAFWVFAYGRVEEARDPRRSWRWPLAAGALVSVLSAGGMIFSFPVPGMAMLHSAFVPEAKNPEGVRAFARDLRARKYGVVRMDPAIASWALEGARKRDMLSGEEADTGITSGDAYSFFFVDSSIDLLARSPFPRCGRVRETPIYFCTRADAALPATVVPSSPVLSLVQLSPERVRREGEDIVVEGRPMSGIATFGPYLRLRPGTYAVSWDVTFERCDDHARPMHADVLRDGNTLLAEGDVLPNETKTELTFEVTAENRTHPLEFRTWAGSCGATIHGIHVRHVAP